MAFRIGQTLPAATKRRSDLRVQSNIWSIGFRWAETLDGAGAAFAPAAAAAIVAFQIRDSPAWAGSVSSPLRCWWARKQGVQTRWSGSRRDSGGALGTLCTPALTCGPDALTQNIQMEAPAALSVWA